MTPEIAISPMWRVTLTAPVGQAGGQLEMSPEDDFLD
jgi:hypothetical protein